jgi:hypothetical protein
VYIDVRQLVFKMNTFIILISLQDPAIRALYSLSLSYVSWVPCRHAMACHRVADGGDGLQIWRVAANVLNKQLRIADKEWPSRLGVGRGANNSSP